uniref:Serum amyloid A protein n=1 Tax=Mola mola TaxID=94237 RepID=A0A3Q4BPI2_MOLML
MPLALDVTGVEAKNETHYIHNTDVHSPYFCPCDTARDMWRAYRDMREANWKNSDKYFHARGNYDAANRGPGGRWAAKVISDAREFIPSRSGHGASDSAADQAANRWGRNGGDPNVYRPPGLPKKY